MSLYYTVGQINNPCKKMHVEWEIPNYISLSQNSDVILVSPPIHFFHAKWNILLYPNGCRQRKSVGLIDIYLEVINPILIYPVIFMLVIKGFGALGPVSDVFSQYKRRGGWHHILERINLERHMKDSSMDVLTVCCDLTANISSVVDKSCQTTFLNSTYLLCRDFQELLQHGEKSDFTIYVHNRVFKVHKLIMESRSPVFAAMFRNNSRENREGVVTIDDCDPDAFGDFLEHMYTGEVKNISGDNAIHLLSIADKYFMTDLKSQCAKFIAEALSVENVYDILLVANWYNETQLKISVETFLIQNIAKIKTTEEWKTFMSENPSTAAHILMKCL